MSELKPCPFCGEPARMFYDNLDDTCIECTNEEECGAMMVHYHRERDAIEAWNRREDPTP